MIDSESELNKDQQLKLVFELRKHYHDGRPANEILLLIQRLKKRDDLFAKVQRDLDDLLAEMDRSQPAPSATPTNIAWDLDAKISRDQSTEALGKTPAVAHEMPTKATGERAGVQVSPESLDGIERQLNVDSAVEECRYFVERAFKNRECWLFEIDPANTLTVELDASATRPTIVAKADMRDNARGAKKKALIALGWKVNDGSIVKSSVAAAALYLTSGLAAAALLSRNVRDVLMSFEGTRSWVVVGDKDALSGPAAEFALALQRVAPDIRTILVKRRTPEPEE